MNSLPEADLILTVLRGEHTDGGGGLCVICPHLDREDDPWGRQDERIDLHYFTGVSANNGEFRLSVGQCPRCGRVYGRKL